MPLVAGKSKQIFVKNVKEMVNAGHPLNQALASAYSKKREHTKAYNKRDRAISAKKKK